MSLVNGCWFRATAGGTGNFAAASAITGYMVPADADALDGSTYSYRASSDDESQWEIGTGVYTASGTTLSRTVLKSSNSNAAVTFSAAPKVALTALAADIGGGGSSVLDVTAVAGVFTIASLKGISQVNLTTDGTGACTLDIAEYPSAGQSVNFEIAALGDPGDSVVINNIWVKYFGFTATLPGEVGQSIALSASLTGAGVQWYPLGSTADVPIISDDIPTISIGSLSQSEGATQFTGVTTSLSFGVFFSNIVLSTGGAGNATDIVFNGVSFWNDNPLPVLMFYGEGSGDTASFDPSTFVDLTGARPTSIVFSNHGESMSLTPYNGSTWLILGASAGVVTP